MDLKDLTLELAQPLVGTSFEVTLPDGSTTTMKLEDALPFEVNVRRRTRSAPPTTRAPFSLYFAGAAEPVLPQGMYTFRSENLVLENLFLVPVGSDGTAVEYEAVFN